jgi:hypothetical protein
VYDVGAGDSSDGDTAMIGEIDLRFEKRHAAELKRLGYRRHPQGAGWVRPVRRAWFPRFHLYATVDWNARAVRFDLHLDHTREDVDSRAPTASGDNSSVQSELQRILKAFPA